MHHTVEAARGRGEVHAKYRYKTEELARAAAGLARFVGALIDASIVRNYVNWTLPGAERQFSMLRRACTRLSSSDSGNKDEKSEADARRREI